MSSTISIFEKKDFLKWFLNAYQLKRRECTWLLNYLMSDDLLMKKVHFVESAEYCPKAIVISANDVDCIPFSFQKRQHVTMDAEKAFHDIRMNKDEEIYIQLNFKDANKMPKYAVVLEDNPFVPVDKDSEKMYSLFAELVIDQVREKHERESLLAQIDKALENNEKDLFFELTDKLNRL